MVDISLKPKYTVQYAIIAVVAVLLLIVLFYYNYTESISTDMFGMLSAGVIILAVLALLATFLKYLAISYTVTDREVVMSEGIITKTMRVVPVQKIDNISVKRGIQDLVLMTGSVLIDTPAGGGAVEISMKRIDAARLDEVSNAIRGLIKKEAPKTEAKPAPAPKQEPEEKAEDAPAEEKPAKKTKGKK